MKKKYLLSVLLLAVAFIFTIVNVDAKGLGVSGEKLTQKGKYDSTRFAAGKEVTNKAEVDGLSFVAGEKVTLNGKAPYGFYAGKELTVSENVERDTFIAGESITLTKDAIIGRDAFLAGKKVKIKSTIERDLRLGASNVDLSGAIIKGDAYIAADSIKLNKDTRILGKLSYAKDTKVTGLTKENANKVKITKARNNSEKKSKTAIVTERIVSILYSIVRTFIVMVLLIWLIPQLDKKLNNEEIKASVIAKKSLVGLGVLFIVPIIAIIALISSLLIPVSLITLMVYGVALYISSIFVYYIVGINIDKKWIKKDNKYLSLLCGIVVIKLISLIPILGGLVSCVVFLYGLGIILNYINSIRKEVK